MHARLCWPTKKKSQWPKTTQLYLIFIVLVYHGSQRGFTCWNCPRPEADGSATISNIVSVHGRARECWKLSDWPLNTVAWKGHMELLFTAHWPELVTGPVWPGGWKWKYLVKSRDAHHQCGCLLCLPDNVLSSVFSSRFGGWPPSLGMSWHRCPCRTVMGQPRPCFWVQSLPVYVTLGKSLHLIHPQFLICIGGW